jgi:hypothetical protein
MIKLNFEIGTQKNPKGHAMLYYKSTASNKVYATYVVVLPLAVDISRYIPPLLANQVENFKAADLTSFAFPPVPEEAESFAAIKSLAKIRGDDVLFGGSIDPGKLSESLTDVNEIVNAYTKIYKEDIEESIRLDDHGSDEFSVGSVVYELMGERDKVSELSKLISKLQFAVEGTDEALLRDTEAEVQALSRYLPDRWNVARLIENAKKSSPEGTKLAQLYLERCYKLLDEDYKGLKSIDEAISLLDKP